MKLNPGMTYQLQAIGKIKLSHYLGQQVEVTRKESPSLRTSSNSSTRVRPGGFNNHFYQDHRPDVLTIEEHRGSVSLAGRQRISPNGLNYSVAIQSPKTLNRR
jgi:hypothetical protein